MTKYTNTINGKVVIKERNRIVINKNGMQTFNPTNEMLLENGWEEYVTPTYTPTIEDVRSDIIRDIEMYDSSISVNEFFVQGQSVWLDKATRAGLLLRFQAEQAQGVKDTALWYNSTSYSLQVDQAIKMLYAIELYASACYDMTEKHIANVKALTSEDEIRNYDYRSGYPEKLRFEVNN